MENRRLRSMSAMVEYKDGITVELSRGSYKINNPVILTSYNSKVAIYDGKSLFLLPRYDYSVTTWKHLHAFIQDYTNLSDLSASDIRKALKDDNDVCFIACNGYVEWIPQHNSYCKPIIKTY